MNAIDMVNAAFEAVGAFACWRDVGALRRARKALGVHWQSRAFFATWGLWNLAYYPALNQWLSFAAGLVIVAANTCWTLLYFYYRKATP